MKKYAVIQLAGKQYLVKEGDEVLVQSLKKEAKEVVDLPILMTFDEKNELEIGTPQLSKVGKGEVTANIKGEKIRVAKFKSKVRYRKVIGFRPQLTKVKIVSL